MLYNIIFFKFNDQFNYSIHGYHDMTREESDDGHIQSEKMLLQTYKVVLPGRSTSRKLPGVRDTAATALLRSYQPETILKDDTIDDQYCDSFHTQF